MKLNISSLVTIFLALTLAQGFLQAKNFQKDLDCTDLKGNWNGLYSFYVPEINKFCLFTTQSQAETTDKLYDSDISKKLVYSTVEDSVCNDDFDYDSFFGLCKYNNGFIIANEGDLQGQSYDGSMMLSKRYTNYVRFTQWSQALQTTQTQFNQDLSKVVQNLNQNGLEQASCLDLNGQWYGKRISNDTNQSNCQFDIQVNIQGTSKRIQMQVYSSFQHYAGKENICGDDPLDEEYIFFCDSKEQTITEQNTIYAGVYSQDFISLSYKSSSTFLRDFIMFRDN